METSQTITALIKRCMYELIRLGFIIVLLISPCFPYEIANEYNSHLPAMLQAQADALPVYPGASLTAEDLDFRLPNVEPCHLRLRLQYQTNVPFEEVEKYYESTLQQSGWHKIDHNYYKKAPMHIRVGRSFKSRNPNSGSFNKKGYRIKIFITADIWQPVFQTECRL